MPVCDHKRAVVKYAAVDIHLPGESRQAVEVALQLITDEVLANPRDVDSAGLPNNKLFDNPGVRRQRTRRNNRADQSSNLALGQRGHTVDDKGLAYSSGARLAQVIRAPPENVSNKAIGVSPSEGELEHGLAMGNLTLDDSDALTVPVNVRIRLAGGARITGGGIGRQVDRELRHPSFLSEAGLVGRRVRVG
jgi:hypothetical protein